VLQKAAVVWMVAPCSMPRSAREGTWRKPLERMLASAPSLSARRIPASGKPQLAAAAYSPPGGGRR
jgi:hypothetical protein